MMNMIDPLERRENALRSVDKIRGLGGRDDPAVVIVGSANADYTVTTPRLPLPGETVIGGDLEVLPGGKSANQAAACSRTGVTAALIGCVGTDSNATFLKHELTNAGVDVSHLLSVDGPSGATLIAVDANGQNSIVVSPGANAHLTSETVETQSSVIEHANYLGLCLEVPIDTVLTAARIARAHGVRTVINLSPFNGSRLGELADATDLLLVNEIECAQIIDSSYPTPDGDATGYGADSDWDQIAEQLRAIGFQQIIITLGGDGCILIDGTDITHIPAAECHVVDTTGCGDAFMGAMLAGLAAGSNLTDAACLAVSVAASAAEHAGAQRSYLDLKDIRI